MIRFAIRVPGEAEQTITIQGDEAVIGKEPRCHVQLGSSEVVRKYVSREHAKVQVGVVVTDLKSVNGVWVDGRRLEGPTLLQTRAFHLGANPESSPQVEILEACGRDEAAHGDAAALTKSRAEVERLQQRLAEVEAELEQLKQADPQKTLPVELGATPAAPMPATSAPEPAVADTVDESAAEAQRDPRDLANSIPSFDDVFSDRLAAPPKAGFPRGREPLTPAAPAPAPARERRASRLDLKHVTGLIERLVREDVSEDPLYEAPVEEFFVLESLRLLRQVEKAVTRLARDFADLYDMKTQLPNQQGNFRTLAAEVLLDPEDRDARRTLVKYLEELRRWLGVSLSANRKAAQQLAAELKKDLSVDALTAERPVPLMLKIFGQEGSELWRRARSHLQSLTEAVLEDRLDRYATKYASEIMDRDRQNPLYR